MKRMILIFAAFAIMVSVVPAQTAIPGVTPKDARSMGMGGAFRVFSDGFSSFYGNPAGFAGMGSLTLADISAWAYVKPTEDTLTNLEKLTNESTSDVEIAEILGEMIGTNGFGAGASLGAGWAGKGFALGANIIMDLPVAGAFPLSTKVKTVSQADLVLGLGIPIRMGPIGLKIGFDGRVFYRLNAPSSGWTFVDIATALLGDGEIDDTLLQSLKLHAGYGFAADAGAVLNIGPLLFGFSVRDLGLAFKMKEISVYDVIQGGPASLPTDGTIPYALTPEYAAGIGVRLFENRLFEPSIYAEVEDPVSLFSSADILTDVFNKLHAGAQLRLLRFITARAGLNKGWISVGAGIDLAMFELDAAVFTEELGLYPGNKGRSGISIQAAVRFGR